MLPPGVERYGVRRHLVRDVDPTPQRYRHGTQSLDQIVVVEANFSGALRVYPEHAVPAEVADTRVVLADDRHVVPVGQRVGA